MTSSSMQGATSIIAFRVATKLHYASTSPFERKAMASATELGFDGHLEPEPAANPMMPTVRNPAICWGPLRLPWIGRSSPHRGSMDAHSSC